MVSTNPLAPPAGLLGTGVERSAVGLLTDGYLHELDDALLHYFGSLRQFDDVVAIRAALTLTEAGLKALWEDARSQQATHTLEDRRIAACVTCRREHAGAEVTPCAS